MDVKHGFLRLRNRETISSRNGLFKELECPDYNKSQTPQLGKKHKKVTYLMFGSKWTALGFLDPIFWYYFFIYLTNK